MLCWRAQIASVFPAAAAKSLQSCPTLCDPIDGSPPGSAVPGILQARTLEWVAISFSNAWKWKVKVKSLSRATLCDPMDCSLPGSSVHGIFQARVPEWGAVAFSEMMPKYVSQAVVSIYSPTNRHEYYHCSMFSSTLGIAIILNFHECEGCETISHFCHNLHSTNVNEVEHIFIHLLLFKFSFL